MNENEVSFEVRRAAFKLHSELGPGLLESVYETALAYELRQVGLHVATQVPLPMMYAGVRMEIGFRLDLVVEGKVVVEIKSVEALAGSAFQATADLPKAFRSQTRSTHQLQRGHTQRTHAPPCEWAVRVALRNTAF